MTLPFRLGLPTFFGKKCRNISYDPSVFGFSWMLLVTKLFNIPGDSGRWAQVRQLGLSLRSAGLKLVPLTLQSAGSQHTLLVLKRCTEGVDRNRTDSGSLGSKWTRGHHCALLTSADTVSSTDKALSWHMNSHGSPSPFLIGPCQRSS